MIDAKLLRKLHEKFPGQVRENESLRSRTTFRCPGVARAVVILRGLEDLAALVQLLKSSGVRRGEGWNVIGRGSNLLVRDGGYSGVLLDLSEGFTKIEIVAEEARGVTVRAEGGAPNGALLNFARDHSLAGFGWAYGIPGSVGGGVRMNAGTPLGSYGTMTAVVEGVDPAGRPVSLPVAENDFRYRDFPAGRDLLITAARLLFRRADPAEVEREVEAAREKRKGQPIDLPNFGSVFKNPPGDFAGRLIEAAGLKGRRAGEAEISRLHANFIVNLGSARTADALSLMETARAEVLSRFGVELEPEVHLIGEDA